MAGITSINISDTGWGYKTAPSIKVSLPNEDSSNATAVAVLSGQKVSSISMVDSGQFYFSEPTVSFSLPTADSETATISSVTLDSAGAAIPYGIGNITVDEAGTYYTTDPNVTFTVTQQAPKNWKSDSARWGEYSYELDGTGVDSNLNNFSNVGSHDSAFVRGINLEFWVYVPDSATTGDIMRFPTVYDSDGSDNKVRVESKNIIWSWTEDSGGTLDSARSVSSEITPSSWHHIQLYRFFDQIQSDHLILVDGVVVANKESSDVTDPMIEDHIVLRNQSEVSGVKLDAIRFNLGNVEIRSIPDTDRNPFDSNSDEDKNYSGFELKHPAATGIVTEGRITGFNITRKGNYLTSVSGIVESSTGVASDFLPIAKGIVDSSQGGKITISVIDSGDFYDSDAPIVTISVANGTAANYRASAVCSLNDSGEVVSVTIVDSGGGYGDDVDIIFDNPPFTEVFANDSANQTLADGTIIRGEIAKYSDSDGVLHLVHVGSDNGRYTDFVTSQYLTFGNDKKTYIRKVFSVGEDNKISQNEQNEEFSTISDDFLDFSEDNPFGDVENN